LGDGRKDESGDYTEGAKLGKNGIKAVLGFTTASDKDRSKTIASLEKLVGTSERGQEGCTELATIDSILTATGFDNNRVSFDTSIVRGLGYYTGPVFEVELLADIRDKKGRPVRIGSIGGGGRYDDLVTRFRQTGIRAEVFIGSGNVTKQMKYADRRNAQIAVLVGEDELAKDEVTLKDLYLGAEAAQKTVSREGFVQAIQAMLC